MKLKLKYLIESDLGIIVRNVKEARKLSKLFPRKSYEREYIESVSINNRFLKTGKAQVLFFTLNDKFSTVGWDWLENNKWNSIDFSTIKKMKKNEFILWTKIC